MSAPESQQADVGEAGHDLGHDAEQQRDGAADGERRDQRRATPHTGGHGVRNFPRLLKGPWSATGRRASETYLVAGPRIAHVPVGGGARGGCNPFHPGLAEPWETFPWDSLATKRCSARDSLGLR